MVMALLSCLFRQTGICQQPRFQLERFFGEKGTEQGRLSNPEGVSVDSEGSIYIADTGNNRIQKFSSSGKFIKLYGGFGWTNEQFDQPVSIYAQSGLDIFVADKNNHRILRFDRHLNFISVFSVDEIVSEAFRFQFPRALVVSPLNEMYVIDGENNRIVHFSVFNAPKTRFGGYESSGEPLNDPVKISLFSSQRILVSDAGRAKIVVYDYFGNYLQSISSSALQEPAGVCTDETGNIFVCDTRSQKIIVFDSDGILLTEYAHMMFVNPYDIACADDRIYVLDRGSSVVLIFKLVY